MLRLECPFGLICAGSTKSGKSQLLLGLIKAEKTRGIFQRPIDRIICVYSTWQPIYQEIDDLYPQKCEFLKSIPWDRLEQFTTDLHTLLIADDLMTNKEETKKLVECFSLGRHRGISIIYTLQNLFHKAEGNTDISRNASYLALFRTPRDARIIKTLSSQMFPEHRNFLYDAFRDATSVPYRPLWIDLTTSLQDRRLQVRSDVLSEEKQNVYIPK